MCQWRPNWEKVNLRLKTVIFATIATLSIFFWFIVIVFSIVFQINPIHFIVKISQISPENLAKIAVGSIVFLAFSLPSSTRKDLIFFKKFALKGNIVTAPFFAIFYIFKFTVCILLCLLIFTKEVFIYVHSEKRVLCFLNAAIGAGVGHLLGSAIAGAIAGGLFGVLSYEVISKKILKVGG